MNKAELIAAMAAKTGETKKAAEASVNAFVEVVTESLKKGDKVQLVDLVLLKLEKEQLEKVETHKLKKKSKYLHQKLQYSKLVKH